MRHSYCVNENIIYSCPVMRGAFRLLLLTITLMVIGAGCTGIEADQSVPPMRLLMPGLLGG
ncbi:uncharacterized protein METZ01_LOCUS326254 [marine metagenome]|uniref:Uncharacterized protein n=1 Tax=marine metagenome TaxID=408172 RepID=A0A382PKX3_9ZZZZ